MVKRWLFVVLLFGSSVAAKAAPRFVSFSPPFAMDAGSIYISTTERALYLVLEGAQAVRYPVAVGKAGKAWRGEAYIESKRLRPDWSPPADVHADHPELPPVVYSGDARNPMGAAALVLDRGQYAIHGTTERMRASIGRAASYGCIRMYNEDVLDLFNRVDVGALVYVGK